MPVDPLALADVGLRMLSYGAALSAIGFALFFTVSARLAARSPLGLLAVAAALTLLSQAGRILLANAQLNGTLAAALTPHTFGWVWAAYGDQTLILAAGAALAFSGAVLRVRIMAGLGALAIAFSFGLAGHAAALPEPGFAPWIVVTHVLLAAGWFVAPVLLWPRGRQGAAHLEAMEAFSQVALYAVPAVFLAGFWLAWRIAGGIEPLLTTTYGQTLMIKALAASLALGLGALNKTVITRRLRTNPTLGRRALYLTLSADAVLFLFILGCVAWVTTIAGPPSHPMSG